MRILRDRPRSFRLLQRPIDSGIGPAGHVCECYETTPTISNYYIIYFMHLLAYCHVNLVFAGCCSIQSHRGESLCCEAIQCTP